jgi:hypothetical protein
MLSVFTVLQSPHGFWATVAISTWFVFLAVGLIIGLAGGWLVYGKYFDRAKAHVNNAMMTTELSIGVFYTMFTAALVGLAVFAFIGAAIVTYANAHHGCYVILAFAAVGLASLAKRTV